MADKPELDEITGRHTTGHEWDGIKELNTPLPRWWVWVFYVCIGWSVLYSIAYPSWPPWPASSTAWWGGMPAPT